jgi:hypothetical protein
MVGVGTGKIKRKILASADLVLNAGSSRECTVLHGHFKSVDLTNMKRLQRSDSIAAFRAK